MTRTRRTLISLAAVAALAAGASVYAAQPEAGVGPGACPYGGPGMGYGPGAGYGRGQGYGPGPGYGRGGPGMQQGGPGRGAGFSPAARVEGRLATLKAELNITAEQETAWQAFAGKAKAQATAMQAQRAAVTATQTAPERLTQRAAFAKQRAANLDTMSAAVKDLYEALTPEQKAIADQRMGLGGGMGGGPGRMGGRGGWR